ncbi:MAG TPA: type IV pilus assembly protein PilM [Planctomycetes bacterium]|nr:type IV pilus assembly protein PilM [Fuerstiella sp.]HIK91886.1 type IV pilus assembly protein PilM [Planctomycetota bacterium]
MAESRSAWGIDIGQAGLKAIKLRLEDDGQKVRAVAFDYIPHPKILSQPDAIPEELIRQSVETFMSRNKVGNDLIGVSVPGQTSLAKFIKLPPVEPSKVAEIVRYEARQQIPFDLSEVIWDYQPIGGGVEESGFMLEAEVGLFAMKRELVYNAMEPLTEQKAEIELVQVSPLALYNYLSFDVLEFRLDGDNTDPPDAEDYYIVLDMGADNTTLLVSNGKSIWIRNVPIGGNHFTRALTRDMKLTFAKAEHLKRNATKAPDPKAVFQAMRPVFNDYVTEIQRSIGYFGSVNRSAKITKVIGVGNGFKMAGLQKFLQQNLKYPVERLNDLKGVTGDGVLSDPLFIDNIMTFAVPYGLALQTLKQTRIHTTLLPPEIVVERTIKRKKPWAAGIAAGLLLATSFATFLNANVLSSVSEEKFKDGHAAVADLASLVSGNTSAYEAQKAEHDANKKAIEDLTAPLQKRELWMELMKAINECLPRDEGNDMDITDPQLQRQLRIQSFVQKKVENVSEWHAALTGGKLKEQFHSDDQEPEAAPDGQGYIITLTGHHFFNHRDQPYESRGAGFVEETLIARLREWVLDRHGAEDGATPTPIGQLGISHPIVVWALDNEVSYDPNARIGTGNSSGGGMGMMRSGMMGGSSRGGDNYEGDSDYESGEGTTGLSGMEGSGGASRIGGQADRGLTPLEEIQKDESEIRTITKTDFVVQFAWVPISLTERSDTPEAAEPAVDEGEPVSE